MSTWQQLKGDAQKLELLSRREKIIAQIRSFLAARKYHEVEVPLLAPSLIPESYLEIFETSITSSLRPPVRAFLTPSPEVFLKKMLVGGMKNIFALTKSFRNMDGDSPLHSCEFAMLEWYKNDANYLDLIDETELLIRSIIEALKIGSDGRLSYQGQRIHIDVPWERLSMIDAFKKYADIDLSSIMGNEAMKQFVIKKGYEVTEDNTWEQLFNQLYLNEVEPKFGRTQPTFIYDFPSPMAALAKKNPNDPRFAERFELFIGGLEICDGYSELTDWKEQEQRFKEQLEERKRLGKHEHPADWDFIEALKSGLPVCSGNALGVDRLVMLLTDSKSISDVTFT